VEVPCGSASTLSWVILYCPRCGAALPVRFRGEWFTTDAGCQECGVAPGAARATLAPSDEELGYGLDEWPVPDRVALTSALAEEGIPYRWEPDVVLVVPAVAEDEVDALLGGLEQPAPGETNAGEPSHDGRGEPADGGAEAHAAMTELFVAADRLRRAPLDQEVAADLEIAAEAVAARLPPYGVDAGVWRAIQTLAAAAVSSSIDAEADEAAVAHDAAALRDFLRPYV
jgi:hypothetical protein